jgi:Uma2 family endonuclease
MVVASPPGMTVDEFLKRHGGELNVDLIDGLVVRYPMPGAEHGRVCTHAGFVFEAFARESKLGRTFTNDTFVRVRDGTLRGADVCYWSYDRLPREARIPKGAIETPPDLVVEVKSPSDLWTDLFGKVHDFLQAGVGVVVAFDPATESVSVFRPGTRQQIFEKDQTLTIPDVLPGFEVAVARFFEE